MKNPFNPTFGDVPSIFLDEKSRSQKIINQIKENSTPRSYFITGVRGSGKTVLLTSLVHSFEKDNNCYCIRLINKKGMVQSLARKLIRKQPKWGNILSNINSFSINGFGVSLKDSDVDIEDVLTELLERIRKQHKYVVIAIDEVTNSKDIREFAQIFNILKQDDLPINVLMTGLPEVILDVQNDDKLTFLLRSEKIYTTKLQVSDMITSYQKIFKSDNTVADKMAQITQGYSYAFQLLGYLLFEEVDGSIPTLTDLKKILPNFEYALFDNAYVKIFTNLSENDRKYLIAVNGRRKFDKVVETMMGEHINNVEKARVFVSQYRRRAIERKLIEPIGYGLVRYTLPVFDKYIDLTQNPDSAYYFGY